jgi:hypothetical protein
MNLKRAEADEQYDACETSQKKQGDRNLVNSRDLGDFYL